MRPPHQRRCKSVDHVVLMNKRKVQQLEQEVVVMTEKKKTKKKEKVSKDESQKCSCGCGQDLTPRETPSSILDSTNFEYLDSEFKHELKSNFTFVVKI